MHNKLSLGFDSLGQQPMKNVAPVTTYRVTMSGQAGTRESARPSIPVVEDPPQAGARRSFDRHDPATWLGAAADWLASQPRSVTVLLTIAAFVVVINVFTGLNRPWAHWPVAALLFVVVLRILGGRRRESDKSEERRRRD